MLKKNFIKAGQKLYIYVPEGQGEYFSKLNKRSNAEKQKSLNEKPSASSTQKLANVAKKETSENKTPIRTIVKEEDKATVEKINEQTVEEGEFVYYKVRRGDNFWTIAKKFPGVSNNDIMKLNNIKEASSLKVGQVLKILPKA